MDGKKISFGFSKIVKKPQLNIVATRNEEKVELIECLEGQEIKVSGKTSPTVNAPLVIPLANGATPLAKLIEQKKAPQVRQEVAENKENPNSKEETLEQRAAREILENLKAKDDENEEKIYAVPMKADELPLDGAKESTMDDYDNIPIQQFGLAMLRGMGWKDEEQKKKEDKIDDTIVCRPKGLGLGADKMVRSSSKSTNNTSGNQDILKIKKSAYVKILGGKFLGMYGQVEGLDEETGRIFVKLARGGQESISEHLIEAVSEKEFMQNRKVINVAKYEEYKKRHEDGEKSQSSHQKSSSRSDREHRRRKSRSRSRSKEERKRSSNSKNRRHRNDSSSSDSDHNRKHSSSRRNRDSKKSSHSRSHHRDRYER
ncbi:G patch domain and KOW motifs-containing protein [Sergentomyia squamirostris]